MTAALEIDRRIHLLAAQSHSIITFDALRHAGVSSNAISRRIVAGSLHRIAPGVYALQPDPHQLDHMGQLRAMMASRHHGLTVASHVSVPVLLNAWPRERHGRAHALSTSSPHRRATPFGTIHTTRSLPSSHLLSIAGLPATTLERAICDLAMLVPAPLLTAVMRQGEYRGVFNRTDMLTVMRQRSWAPNITSARVAFDMYEGSSYGSRSRSEDRGWVAVDHYGLPHPQLNVRGATGHPDMECDFVWDEARLVVEIDGPHHDLSQQRELDEARDSVLHDDGWRVVRIGTAWLWDNPLRATANVISRALSFEPMPYRIR